MLDFIKHCLMCFLGVFATANGNYIEMTVEDGLIGVITFLVLLCFIVGLVFFVDKFFGFYYRKKSEKKKKQ